MSALFIGNRSARHLWLVQNRLLGPRPDGVLDSIAALGFVQIDTIRNVVRAQDHILWSRWPRYREGQVWAHLENRELFEHFTHDASLLPAEILPLWQGQFARLGARAARHEWYRSGLGQQEIAAIRARITAEGPLSTHAFDSKITGARQMWARPPHKKALEQMWYAGELATSHRRNFVKFYDLGARVFPPHCPAPDAEVRLNSAALDRLGMATPGELQRFWGAVPTAAVRGWIEREKRLVAVEVEGADGSRKAAWAPADIEARLAALPAPGRRMRLINPFDPAVRDRARLMRLFGFEYRNEMFVPRAQRRWGYYVYPLLEGLRFVGRIELKASRDKTALRVTGFWAEPGVQWPASRHARLAAELARFARLGGLGRVEWALEPGGKPAHSGAGQTGG